MSLTRAQFEGLLVPRTQLLLDAAQMSVVKDGTNPDLNNALADTLLRFGVVPVDPTLVTDADLAAIDTTAAGSLRTFLDWAELRLKRDILARLMTLVTQSAQTSYINLSDMASRLQKDIDATQLRLDQAYQQGAGRVVITQPTLPYAWGPHTPQHWGWPWGWWP